MKKRIFCGLITLIMIASCFYAMAIGTSATEDDNIVIVIDPGHGGTDPGNTGSVQFGGDYESHHVYDISKYVEERLNQYEGVTVYLTRENIDDTADCPTLESRPNFAKEKGADAFVSIHTNSFAGTGRAYGAEIWVPDANISFNNKIAVDSQAASSVVLATMNEQTGVRARSSNKTSTSSSAKYSTGENADKLVVLRGGRTNNIPVVMLVETCFATDESDYNSFLATTEKRMKMGYAIADGLASYYKLAPKVPTGLTAQYGNTLSSVSLPAGWSWVNPDAKVGNAGTNHFPATFTGADAVAVTENLAVTVEKATPTYTIPKNLTAQFKSQLSSVALPEGWAWQKGAISLDRLGTFSFDAIFTPEDTNNYISIKAKVSVTITCEEHIYENSCDTECDCGFVREITHTYDNACDAECNICKAVRTPADHVYSFPCDAICNVCGAEREAEAHVYTNDCDKVCNVCDGTREIAHSYDNNCDPACNVCGDMREITHVYSHVCDAYCDVCGAKREVDNHTYTNDCDSYCDICSANRTPADHVYTNACDTDCDVCGSDREITHTFDNDCDGDCNVCGTTRATAHVFDNGCDKTCNVCGATRNVSHNFDSDEDTECNVCGAVRASATVDTKKERGCRSSISGIFAIIASVAIGFAFTRKKK